MQAVLRDVVVQWNRNVEYIAKDIAQILPGSRVVLYGLLREQVVCFIFSYYLWNHFSMYYVCTRY